MTTNETSRTLGELTVDELLRSAIREALAIGDETERDAATLKAYSGSIAARISVARDKFERTLELLERRPTGYTAQAARDAEASDYGTRSYWDYLERAELEMRDYYLRRGDLEKAAEMLTRSLSEALRGNDGP